MFLTSHGLVCLCLAVCLCPSRGTSVANRTLCGPGDVEPGTRVNTTGRLADFRTSMNAISLKGGRKVMAFVVGSADAHNSEYPSDFDKRRKFISGFGGSAGTAVITETKAALWTDGRYFLEADEVLDCNWILMKQGLKDTPSIEDWLNTEMTSSGEWVGVDKTLISLSSFETMATELSAKTNSPVLKAVDHKDNPVDKVWTTGRPKQPLEPVKALNIKFAGRTWQEKIADLRDEMVSKSASAFIVTSLDDTAWLFNLRGSDISYNPFFMSYAIVETNRIRLYILDKDTRLVKQPTDPETDQTLAAHLATSSTGTCSGSGTCVEVVDYNQSQFESDLSALSTSTTATKIWMSNVASHAVYIAVPKEKRLVTVSPIAVTKSVKNEVERAGMQNANTRDSVTLIKFLAFLEKQIADGKQWTEVSAALELDKRRLASQYSQGLSFGTISGFGSNGAVIHYSPSTETDKKITEDSLYLLDSGGQYLDGTTDVTRTMHYGKPTAYQKECYTRVLASAINLGSLHWPSGLYGRQIDVLARYQLWDAGLVYRHGTGHGVGAYLSVHEGPGFISMTRSVPRSDNPLAAYQVFSDEPGYYEDNSFGIRLETLVMISPDTPKYQTSGQDFLRFIPITLVPFETNLVDVSMLTRRQVEWLNAYNSQIRSAILPLLSHDRLAVDWVNSRTKVIAFDPNATQGAGGRLPYRCDCHPHRRPDHGYQRLSLDILLFPQNNGENPFL